MRTLYLFTLFTPFTLTFNFRYLLTTLPVFVQATHFSVYATSPRRP